ncbi:ParB/RepB/Spo0J family partition protein [Neorickettsia sennetsu]|uniref:Probable chromosome-partitioning protein ParB n=1 Tax=Ehrlichia sennetsu (strain ATCC VR-367 / Miyayama) TaxID=222891 RepID=Q2GF09_EHRS3|nr:ParB/RepB/Spo0J family partition protein [Neorickettsia sennetsu]ABD46029.1 chromosome partitioning protein, ParB family [Neorickettsia sennetsu str. Miyayama]
MRLNENIVHLKLNEVDVNDFQPRKVFDEASIAELEESIKRNGLIQPIIVRKFGERYKLIAGERRLRAMRNLGAETIPSIVRDFTDKTSLEVAIVENIQRKDLTPLEEAEAYKRLIDEFNYKHVELASIVGKSRSHVTNHLRILSLPKRIKELLEENRISLGHVKLLTNVEDSEKMAEKIARLSLSVRQAENLLRDARKKNNPHANKKSHELCMLEKKISERLGMKVTITDSERKNGNVKITFKNLDELQDILERLS